jgi:adenosylcobinamide-GDP ribazoletransferase
MLRAALIAVQFLTCFPVRLAHPPAGREVGLSLLWYPAVGLLLGMVLWAAAVLLGALDTPLTAALVLTVWVGSTGALHLDGLADTADAWIGGRGNRERTLAIMKDPHVGTMAVAAVVCLLLVKFGALSSLIGAHRPAWRNLQLAYGCILPPVLARAAVPVLFAHSPYARPGGLGADLAQHQSRAGGLWVAACTALTAVALAGRAGLLATAAATVAYLLLRQAFIQRLGGVTGDCIGAMIEVIETLALVTLACR